MLMGLVVDVYRVFRALFWLFIGSVVLLGLGVAHFIAVVADSVLAVVCCDATCKLCGKRLINFFNDDDDVVCRDCHRHTRF